MEKFQMMMYCVFAVMFLAGVWLKQQKKLSELASVNGNSEHKTVRPVKPLLTSKELHERLLLIGWCERRLVKYSSQCKKRTKRYAMRHLKKCCESDNRFMQHGALSVIKQVFLTNQTKRYVIWAEKLLAKHDPKWLVQQKKQCRNQMEILVRQGHVSLEMLKQAA